MPDESEIEYDAKLDLLAPADDLAGYLSSVPKMAALGLELLTKIDVIVDRQKDIEAEMETAVAKESGVGIFISLDGWSDVPGTSSEAKLHLTHSVSLWSVPHYEEQTLGQIRSEVALGMLIRAIHSYRPNGSRGCQYRWKVGAGAFVVTKTHRVFEFPATYEVIL